MGCWKPSEGAGLLHQGKTYGQLCPCCYLWAGRGPTATIDSSGGHLPPRQQGGNLGGVVTAKG